MKIIAEKLDNKFTVKIQLSKDETVNKFDYGMVSTGTYNTLARVSQMQFDDERMLVYHASSDKSLEEWLSEKHSEFDFTSILSSAVKTFADIIDGGLPAESILFDCKYIFLNDKNKTIEFLYVPINGYKSITGPYEFVSDFMKKIEFQPGENPEYLSELSSIALKKDFSFRKFREKIDEICGKSIREEHKVIFDSDDDASKKTIKKKGEIYLREIPGGTNAIPLQKKVKTEPGQINSEEKPQIQQAQPIRPIYNPMDMAYSSVKKVSKKEKTKNNQENDENIFPQGEYIISNTLAPSKKNKLSKKQAKKAAKAAQAMAVPPATGGFAIPGTNSDVENANLFEMPGVSTDLSKPAKRKKESKGHGINLTEMLIDFIRKQKEKKNEQETEVETKDKPKKEKKKKAKKIESEFEVPNINSSNVNEDDKVNDIYSKKQNENNSFNIPDFNDIQNDNDRRKEAEKIKAKEEKLLESERAKLEKEKAEHEAKFKELAEAQRLENEKQREARENAEREAEEKRKAEEDRLNAERNEIAKEKEAQKKEAMRISEEKKRIEAERAKLEKEIADKIRTEQKKSGENSSPRNDEEVKPDKSEKSKRDMQNIVIDDALLRNIKSHTEGSSEEKYSDDDPTVLLPNNNYVAYLYPKLLRKKTNETVCISKSAYRIGKEKSNVDYCISNNSAISRLHAIIYCKEGRYFIVDTLSTNHTFVNGKIITSNQNYELLSGDIITLANEDFEFTI